MRQNSLRALPPMLLAIALLVAGPAGWPAAMAPARAEAADQASGHLGQVKGKVLGISRKAKTIAVKAGKQTMMIGFDQATAGLAHARKGEAVIIDLEKRDRGLMATRIRPKLARLPKGVSEMQPAELARLVALGPRQGRYLLVDSRPANRYHAGHIPTAISVPVPTLKKQGRAALAPAAVDPDIQLIFYCGGPT